MFIIVHCFLYSCYRHQVLWTVVVLFVNTPNTFFFSLTCFSMYIGVSIIYIFLLELLSCAHVWTLLLCFYVLHICLIQHITIQKTSSVLVQSRERDVTLPSLTCFSPKKVRNEYKIPHPPKNRSPISEFIRRK